MSSNLLTKIIYVSKLKEGSEFFCINVGVIALLPGTWWGGIVRKLRAWLLLSSSPMLALERTFDLKQSFLISLFLSSLELQYVVYPSCLRRL